MFSLRFVLATMISVMRKSETATEKKITAAQIIGEVRELADAFWLPKIYVQKVRTLRTRAHQFAVQPKEHKTEIFYTLLGVELKVAKQKISCPDLATARFLQVFARFGCTAVAVPYDITKISVLADELESAWQRSLLLLEQKTAEHNFTQTARLRHALVKDLRIEIEAAGAGAAVPEFNQNTKQRMRDN